MTRHTTTIITLLIAGALSMTLFFVKHQVQELEDEIVQLNRSVIADEQEIHVLKAEWSYLNSPSRLRELSSKHLGLGPVKPEQIISVVELPDNAFDNDKGDPPKQLEETPRSQYGGAGKKDDFFQNISSALAE